MKLKVQKDNVNDPTYIEVDELLKGCVKELPDLSKYASKADVDELMERVKSLSFLLHKGVFDLVAPINITSLSEIEAINEVQEGVMYWDFDNKRLRLKTEKGWKTIKPE